MNGGDKPVGGCRDIVSAEKRGGKEQNELAMI